MILSGTPASQQTPPRPDATFVPGAEFLRTFQQLLEHVDVCDSRRRKLVDVLSSMQRWSRPKWGNKGSVSGPINASRKQLIAGNEKHKQSLDGFTRRDIQRAQHTLVLLGVLAPGEFGFSVRETHRWSARFPGRRPRSVRDLGRVFELNPTFVNTFPLQRRASHMRTMSEIGWRWLEAASAVLRAEAQIPSASFPTSELRAAERRRRSDVAIDKIRALPVDLYGGEVRREAIIRWSYLSQEGEPAPLPQTDCTIPDTPSRDESAALVNHFLNGTPLPPNLRPLPALTAPASPDVQYAQLCLDLDIEVPATPHEGSSDTPTFEQVKLATTLTHTGDDRITSRKESTVDAEPVLPDMPVDVPSRQKSIRVKEFEAQLEDRAELWHAVISRRWSDPSQLIRPVSKYERVCFRSGLAAWLRRQHPDSSLMTLAFNEPDAAATRIVAALIRDEVDSGERWLSALSIERAMRRYEPVLVRKPRPLAQQAQQAFDPDDRYQLAAHGIPAEQWREFYRELPLLLDPMADRESKEAHRVALANDFVKQWATRNAGAA